MKAHSDPATRGDVCLAKVTRSTPLAIGAWSGSDTLWWKQAIRQVAVAALRLHHYRYVRTRMFRDALSREDLSESVCARRCGDQAVNKH